MGAESLAKAYILTHGVKYSRTALDHAVAVGAKRQNMVYNLPAAERGAGGRDDAGLETLLKSEMESRPQELFLTADDGYTVCVSAVAPVAGREPAIIDFVGDRLSLTTPASPDAGRRLSWLAYVPQPAYYGLRTASGRPVPRWVSACGYDEMNVWPWHDCSIGHACSFCGINAIQKRSGVDVDLIHALDLRREQNVGEFWGRIRARVLAEITEAVSLAIDDPCYNDEIHLILISGNLADHQLDAQALIYADIAESIARGRRGRFAEGIVAVTAPPHDPELLWRMREGGIEVGVFNLEAFTPSAFARHCPGKDRLGRDHYLRTLAHGVEVFGRGRSWCNFVLGLEPAGDLLAGCEKLASLGVTPGANVLHRDYGASLRCDPPSLEEVLSFYSGLADIYRRHELRPYYCERALRTSLANEAFAGRLREGRG
jgi:hypothetical protein